MSSDAPPPLTSPTIEQIHRHASVRHFSDEPVPSEVVETIVLAGQRAATSSNMQRYSVVAVTDPDTRAHLAELCSGQDQIRRAPVFLAWCADANRLDRVCEARGYALVSDYIENFLVAAVDVALVMQNAVLAAESLGYGACMIGAIRSRPAEVIELLGLPRLVFPISGMTLGRAAAPAAPKPRLATYAILHWERYDSSGEAELIDEYDRTMAESGIYAGRQVAAPGVEGEIEAYGWMEHSARRVSQRVRTDMRAVIEAQGFGLK
jgi:FMN reductase (NADPH)